MDFSKAFDMTPYGEVLIQLKKMEISTRMVRNEKMIVLKRSYYGGEKKNSSRIAVRAELIIYI